MYFDDYIDEVVEDEEEEEDSEDSDDGNSSGFGSFTKKSDPERVFVPNLPVGPNGKTYSSPQKAGEAKTLSTAATAGSDEEKAQEDGADVKLLAGIIDYCVVLGMFDAIHAKAILCVHLAMFFASTTQAICSGCDIPIMSCVNFNSPLHTSLCPISFQQVQQNLFLYCDPPTPCPLQEHWCTLSAL